MLRIWYTGVMGVNVYPVIRTRIDSTLPTGEFPQAVDGTGSTVTISVVRAAPPTGTNEFTTLVATVWEIPHGFDCTEAKRAPSLTADTSAFLV